MSHSYVIGLDFGTDSVRSVLIDAATGAEAGSRVAWYPRWQSGAYCEPAANQFRQHPLDHLEAMTASITELLAAAEAPPAAVKAICVDTTGSSPVPLDREGRPLAFHDAFAANPNAMMVLWKDHTAIAEADEVNRVARSWGGEDFTKYEGGIYSSEWFWAKILHIVRNDPEVRASAWTWMEHCDLMPYLLCGSPPLHTFKRSRCAAGHKAMWHPSWGGLPPKDFLNRFDPYLGDLRERLYDKTYTSDEVAGTLSPDWAERLGLTTGTVIAVGTFDAHAGAVGAQIGENTLVRVMGTSTCDIIVSSNPELDERTVRGICGQVEGSVIPQLMGLEAGQSAFGDVLAWFKGVILEPLYEALPESKILPAETRKQLLAELEDTLIARLSAQAESLPVDEHMPVALDWINGRRTPDADQSLKAAIMGLNLGTGAVHIFKALVEAICFGSRKIVDRFEQEGVVIREVVGIGGVAKKNAFVMQTLANVLDRPIKVAVSEQAPALGAAMYAAVAGGLHPDVSAAQKAMGSGFEKTYFPEAEKVPVYEQLYQRYSKLAGFVEQTTQRL